MSGTNGDGAMTIMEQRLPEYIKNIFVACGYDTTPIIAAMDVSQSSQPNDVDKMLDYVKRTFPNDSRFAKILKIDALAIASQNRFYCGDFVTSEPTIPPGHRNIISQFVRDVRRSLQPTMTLKSALNKTKEKVKKSKILQGGGDLIEKTCKLRKRIAS